MSPATEHAAVDLMLGQSLTRAPVDLAKATIIWRSLPEMRSLVLAKRRSWLTWLTVTQRSWQSRPRTSARARDLSSIVARERYVRCS